MGFFFNDRAFIKRLIIIVLTLIIILLLVMGRCSMLQYRQTGVFSEDTVNYNDYILRRGIKSDNTVSFSCIVDGWGNENIDKMLDTFDKYGVKVTFFITGKWAEEYPGIAKKLISRGHEVGSLGYSGKAYLNMRYDQIHEDMEKGKASIEAATGSIVTLFSPPSGVYSDDVIKSVRDMGFNGIILYSIDTEDRKGNSSSELIHSNIFNKLEKCDIILIHPTQKTADALNKILEDLLSQNYKVLPVGEMLKK